MFSIMAHLFPKKAAEIKHKQAQSCKHWTVTRRQRECHAIPAQVQAAERRQLLSQPGYLLPAGQQICFQAELL
jgi:hypothetical protein